MSKEAKALKKAPENMTREELEDALRLSRATVWELSQTVRRQQQQLQRQAQRSTPDHSIMEPEFRA